MTGSCWHAGHTEGFRTGQECSASLSRSGVLLVWRSRRQLWCPHRLSQNQKHSGLCQAEQRITPDRLCSLACRAQIGFNLSGTPRKGSEKGCSGVLCNHPFCLVRLLNESSVAPWYTADPFVVTAVDKLASDLLLAASSLLLLQSALQGKVAQSFLKVLQNLRVGRSEGLLESYGGFYRELLSSGYSSWQDCLLDEVT